MATCRETGLTRAVIPGLGEAGSAEARLAADPAIRMEKNIFNMDDHSGERPAAREPILAKEARLSSK